MIRTVDWAVPLADGRFETYDDDRFVSGVANRFGVENLTGLNLDGSEHAHATFDPGSFDGQLARISGHDVARIRLDVDHEVESAGCSW